MTPMAEDVCMEGSNLWAVASGCLVTCLSAFFSLISKEDIACCQAPSSSCLILTTLQNVFPWEEDLHEGFSGVGIRIALQPAPHACILCCHTGLKASKHAQLFACTPCPVLFLTFPLRDRSTSDEKIIQIIWSLGTTTKGKNNNSSAALLICIEDLGSFFAEPSGFPHTAVKLYALNPKRQLEFSAIGCQISYS